MLQASGVYNQLELKQSLDSRFTLFVPVDHAFADIPRSIALQSLPSDQKILVLKAHVLPIYYPLSLLLTTTNPEQITLAT
ncbi:fasciclin-like arabinogalactan protein [Trifolium medium]|uniref:Fasciclin-like arabinogalactan protein n=1 Tax=Trifolium medium TaxID=97028 RepID=A0A392PVZ4_9FABA|nr:fasciclin-like arabinogalactan protein [Trifolium medium]